MTDAERLAEAENAYHLLNTGQQAAVFVDQNGERVEFTRVKVTDLAAYIRELKGRVNPISVSVPGPFEFIF